MKDASGDSAWPGTTQFLAFGLTLSSPYPSSLVWSTRRLGVAADGIASRLAVVVVVVGEGAGGIPDVIRAPDPASRVGGSRT